jgi:signal transduction histidine kinase
LKSTDIIGKNYLINFLLAFLLVLMGGIAVSALTLYLNIHQPLDTHYSAALSIMSDLKDTIIFRSLIISAIISFMMFLGLLFLGILYTHRIAGPLYRVKVAAKSIGNGYIGEKIKLRRKDVIHSFAECVNDLTGTYSDKVKLLKSDINQLKDSVNELKNLPDDKKSLDSNVKKISDINGHINSLIENIKI